MNKDDSNSLDIQEGDDICRSCTGIIYYSAAMRAAKSKPLCIGFERTLLRRIPQDRIDQLDKMTKKNDLGFFIGIGYSQTSKRMERLGIHPVCIKGIELYHSVAVIPTNPNISSGNPSGSRSNQVYIFLKTSSLYRFFFNLINSFCQP